MSTKDFFNDLIQFIAAYCNHRGYKNGKGLVKKNTAFYFQHSNTLNKVRDQLLRIAFDLQRVGTFSLERVLKGTT